MAWALAAVTLLAIAGAALAVWERRNKGTRHSRSLPREEQHGGLPPPAPASPPATAPRSCPVCLCEYASQSRFCVRDGAELVDGGAGGPFAPGMICPTCRHGYPSDSSFCPDDADELVPYGLYGAASSTRSPLPLDASKICPECGARQAAAHSFCGRDGTELVVVN
jgi:hypothetical protein